MDFYELKVNIRMQIKFTELVYHKQILNVAHEAKTSQNFENTVLKFSVIKT